MSEYFFDTAELLEKENLSRAGFFFFFFFLLFSQAKKHQSQYAPAALIPRKPTSFCQD